MATDYWQNLTPIEQEPEQVPVMPDANKDYWQNLTPATQEPIAGPVASQQDYWQNLPALPPAPTPPAKGSPLYEADLQTRTPAATGIPAGSSLSTGVPPSGSPQEPLAPTAKQQASDIVAMQMLNPAIAATPWGREFQKGAAESATPFGLVQPSPLPEDASAAMKGSRMAGQIAGGVASFILPGTAAAKILSKFPKYTAAINLLAKTNPKSAQIINGALHNIITFPIQHQMYMPIMTDVKTRLKGIKPSEIEAAKFTGANVIGLIPKVGKPIEALALFGIGYGTDNTIPQSERIINGAVLAGLGIFNMVGRGTYKPLTIEATLRDAGMRPKDAAEVSKMVVEKIKATGASQPPPLPTPVGEKEISTIQKSIDRGVEVPYAEQARATVSATYKPMNLGETRAGLEAKAIPEIEVALREGKDETGNALRPEAKAMANMALADKYEAAGNMEAANSARDAALKAGSSAGQILRTMAEWYRKNPAGMLSMVQRLFAKNKAPLTAVQSEALKPKIARLAGSQSAVEVSENVHRDNPSALTRAALDAARLEHETAWLDMANDVRNKMPRSVADSIWSMIQGKILTPMSQMQNIYQNLLFAPTRGGIEIARNMIDAVYSFASGQGRLINPTAIDKMRSVKRAISTARKAAISLKDRGDLADISGDIASSDFRPTIKPVEALSKLWNRDIAIPENLKGLQRTSYVINTVLDALSPDAAFNFRMLALGDIPFRQYSRAAELYRYGREKGLTGDKLEAFVEAPPDMEFRKASETAKEDVFQKSNIMSDLISFMDKAADKRLGEFGPWAKLMYKSMTGIVFTLTPSNIIKQVGKLSLPPVMMARGVARLAKANRMFNSGKKTDANTLRRQAESDIAYGFVGSAIIGTAVYLQKIGAISPTAPKDEKQRAATYTAGRRPQSVNISLIRRQMAGKNDGSWHDGDNIVSLTRMGIPGMIVGTVADTGAELQTKTLPKQEGLKPEMEGTSVDAIASYAKSLGYTMLQNVSTLKGIQLTTDAMASGDYKKMLGNLWELYSNIPVPNAYSQLQKSANGYLVRTSDDDILGTLKNRWAKKIGNYDGLPKVRDIWGDLVTEGTSPSDAYIDVAGWTTIGRSPETSFVWDLARSAETREDAANMLPPVPDRAFSYQGKKMEWSAGEYDKILAETGQLRRKMVFNYMRSLTNENPQSLENQRNRHKKALQKIYSQSLEIVEKPYKAEKIKQRNP